jgi:twinkle protein
LTRAIPLSQAIKEASQYLGISAYKFEPQRTMKSKPIQKAFSALQSESQVMKYLTSVRKLTKETLEIFKISEQGREIVFPYWRDEQLVFVKYLSLDRSNGKKQIRAEKDCEPTLFGWHTLPPDLRSVLICEGEIDAMTLYQYGFPALSVPFGGGKGNKQSWIETEFERLSIFDEFFLCFDNDAEGKAAVEEIVSRLGAHRCRIVELPYKDANECLLAGVTKEEISQCIFNAKTLDPTELKKASVFIDEVIEQFYPSNETLCGILPPWEKAHDKVSFRPGELSIWTGINGHGKSQVLGQIALHAMQQEVRVCIASLELKPSRLLWRLTRQAAGLSMPSKQHIHTINDWYGESLWVFDLVGTAKSKRLLEVFLYARQRYGIDMFIIDSFMKLDIAEDDYKAQKAFLEQLCDFKNQYNCHIHLIIHPRKGADENSVPSKLDNKGTGAMSDLADNCFTVWRNKSKESIRLRQLEGKHLDMAQMKELNACDCLWVCDKQRNGDWEGKIGLYFDLASYQYLERQEEKAKPYVEYLGG